MLSVTNARAVVTQAMSEWPWLCMYADADPATGTVWAKLDFCNYAANFFFSAASDSDHTVRFGGSRCLNVGQGGVSFEQCREGDAQQQWSFKRLGGVAKKVVGADDSDVGQYMLMDPGSSGHTCLQAVEVGNYPSTYQPPQIGAKVEMMPCNDSSKFQSWIPQPAPPESKTVLALEALRRVANACLMIDDKWGDEGESEVIATDCEADVAGKFWVRDGDLVRSTVSSSKCLAYSVSAGARIGVLHEAICKAGENQSWSFDETTGALALKERPGDGCLTLYFGSDNEFSMQPCTGKWDQRFTFGDVAKVGAVSAGPAVVIFNAGQCRDDPSWFDSTGTTCLWTAEFDMCGPASDMPSDENARHGMSLGTACCACQEHYYIGISGRSVRNGAQLVLRSSYKPSLFQWRSTWSWTNTQDGAITLDGTTSYCIDAGEQPQVGDYLQLMQCDGSVHQQWTYDRTTGTVALANEHAELCMTIDSLTDGARIRLSTCDETGMGWGVFLPNPKHVEEVV